MPIDTRYVLVDHHGTLLRFHNLYQVESTDTLAFVTKEHATEYARYRDPLSHLFNARPVAIDSAAWLQLEATGIHGTRVLPLANIWYVSESRSWITSFAAPQPTAVPTPEPSLSVKRGRIVKLRR